MASELSQLIEAELKQKGYTADDLEEGGAAGSAADGNPQNIAAPHKILMGALRVEARVKE
eukprot:CAMPEP_0119110282 /NCGR_PEP_ID=MMETSP1180-20130426/28431_1 /TAXON_ID=3052 ORGANISM="Chlamydomonas cf sp, Strain CCMP681" /NCGR_SAMPLE_ID=MMETSP1180 /ASSEMBLY_ACC=CAM_ASM_000741 /LENGTH=59 /DNA_ID=CAMNT_0007096523 /DNA_START=136 /DNA_END=312 /DNA_ORIENTATION=-